MVYNHPFLESDYTWLHTLPFNLRFSDSFSGTRNRNVSSGLDVDQSRGATAEVEPPLGGVTGGVMAVEPAVQGVTAVTSVEMLRGVMGITAVETSGGVHAWMTRLMRYHYQMYLLGKVDPQMGTPQPENLGSLLRGSCTASGWYTASQAVYPASKRSYP